MLRVKICGITTVSDARAALDLGADAIGVVFAESPRRVSIKEAAKISRAVGPWAALVGVFVKESPAFIRRVARECGLSAIQLHNDWTPGELKEFETVKVIKTFRVDSHFNATRLKNYHAADAFLFDTKIDGRMGGTGKTFDWKILKKIAFKKPVIISGGLNPGNVSKAVRFFKPYGVDVSSGVEKSPGKKDLRLVREFIRIAKKTDY